jgi:MoaA/NifB/PqqE/SkfB family radical SAM enzyme
MTLEAPARITPQKVFAHLDTLHAWQRGERPAPVTLEWDLSNRCTLGCELCHFAHTHVRGPWTHQPRTLPGGFESTGDLADPALVKQALFDVAAVGVQAVVWAGGGEPTTHPYWESLLATGAAVGLQQGMYTLGGLLTRQSAAVLAQHASWVVVSLDAADADTYAAEKGVGPDRFEAACQGVRWLAEAGTTTVGVSFLIHAGNWTWIPLMYALAQDLGATYTTFRPRIDCAPDDSLALTIDRAWIGSALGLLEEAATCPNVECNVARFLAYRDWNGRSYAICHGIKLSATITPDGRVWVCPQRRGFKDSCLGNLRTESFETLWARHPGQWTDFANCRVMCRLYRINEQLAPVFAEYQHPAFV